MEPNEILILVLLGALTISGALNFVFWRVIIPIKQAQSFKRGAERETLEVDLSEGVYQIASIHSTSSTPICVLRSIGRKGGDRLFFLRIRGMGPDWIKPGAKYHWDGHEWSKITRERQTRRPKRQSKVAEA